MATGRWIGFVLKSLAFLLCLSSVRCADRNCFSPEPTKSTPENDRAVVDCAGLQEAFLDEKVKIITLKGNVCCGRKEWEKTIVIRRAVLVRGRDFGELESVDDIRSIDFGDLGKVLVAEWGAIITFQHLVLFQDEMGIGGLNVPFFVARKSAVGLFGEVVVGVRSCVLPVSLFDAGALKRPDFAPGVQRATSMTDGALLEDVAIEWPNMHSIWYFCGAIFSCDAESVQEKRIVDHVLSFYQPDGFESDELLEPRSEPSTPRGISGKRR